MIFWQVPIGLTKSFIIEYGFIGLLGSLMLIVPFLALPTTFFYQYQTEELNPCLEYDYVASCGGVGETYDCYEEYRCVKRKGDVSATADSKLYSLAEDVLLRFVELYFIVPIAVYILWKFGKSWLEKRYPKVHRFFERRWAEVLISFLYLNTFLAIIVGYIWFF